MRAREEDKHTGVVGKKDKQERVIAKMAGLFRTKKVEGGKSMIWSLG